jgi:hypothetical protein
VSFLQVRVITGKQPTVRIERPEFMLKPLGGGKSGFQRYNEECLAAGLLGEVKIPDRTGRELSYFAGDPECCWEPFKYPAKKIVGFGRRG